jgi:hypothetical protein
MDMDIHAVALETPVYAYMKLYNIEFSKLNALLASCTLATQMA